MRKRQGIKWKNRQKVGDGNIDKGKPDLPMSIQSSNPTNGN